MTRYEWHLNKSEQLQSKAHLITSHVVPNLKDRLQNRMYDIWMEHVQVLDNNADYHRNCAANLTLEEANESLSL
jgi:hypothetical protein